MSTKIVHVDREQTAIEEIESWEFCYTNTDREKESVVWPIGNRNNERRFPKEFVQLNIDNLDNDGTIPIYVKDIPNLIKALQCAYDQATKGTN